MGKFHLTRHRVRLTAECALSGDRCLNSSRATHYKDEPSVNATKRPPKLPKDKIKGRSTLHRPLQLLADQVINQLSEIKKLKSRRSSNWATIKELKRKAQSSQEVEQAKKNRNKKKFNQEAPPPSSSKTKRSASALLKSISFNTWGPVHCTVNLGLSLGLRNSFRLNW